MITLFARPAAADTTPLTPQAEQIATLASDMLQPLLERGATTARVSLYVSENPVQPSERVALVRRGLGATRQGATLEVHGFDGWVHPLGEPSGAGVVLDAPFEHAFPSLTGRLPRGPLDSPDLVVVLTDGFAPLMHPLPGDAHQRVLWLLAAGHPGAFDSLVSQPGVDSTRVLVLTV